jgi:hypothetical protein
MSQQEGLALGLLTTDEWGCTSLTDAGKRLFVELLRERDHQRNQRRWVRMG